MDGFRTQTVFASHCTVHQEKLYTNVLAFAEVMKNCVKCVNYIRARGLKEDIKLFMEKKHQNVAFLSDENWLNDLACLIDITQHLSELNLKQQGKSQLVNKLFEHICAH